MSTNSKSWQKISEKRGISVFKRAVPGSEFKEFKGVITVEASLNAFAALLLDAPNMASWMHKTDEVRVLEQIAEDERIAYMLFDFAPLGKRELVVRNKVTQHPENRAVTYSMDYHADHGELANTPYSQIKGITGFVKAVPKQNRAIEITYQCHVEPGIKLLEVWGASTITNKLLADTPYYTLKEAKQRISMPRYRDAQLSFIRDAHRELA